MDTSLTLFGYDLGKLSKWLQLGVSQLLDDPDAWLQRRFSPDIYLWLGGDRFQHIQRGVAAESESAPTKSDLIAMALPAEQTLFKEIFVPAETEIFLADTVAMEVAAASPFAPEETLHAWKVLERTGQTLRVGVGIIATATVNACAAAARDELERKDFELWLCAEEGWTVPLSGGEPSTRHTLYRGRLRNAGLLGLFITALICLSLLMPASATKMRAGQMSDLLAASNADARDAVVVRDRLQEQRQRFRLVNEALEGRPSYHFWLNHIAAATPDSVYFASIAIEGTGVTVTGYADNAAAYLSQLTEQGQYSNVSAASAFVRDPRSGLERLTISWTLDSE